MNLLIQNEKPMLSQKQIVVLQLLCEDYSTKEIASFLELSTRTIETMKDNIRLKFDARHISAVIYKALQEKIIPVNIEKVEGNLLITEIVTAEKAELN